MDIISYALKKRNPKKYFNTPSDEDFAILALLSYCNFHLLNKKRNILLRSLTTEDIHTITKGIYSEENVRLLLNAIKENKAYKSLKVIKLQFSTDLEQTKQFYVVVFKIYFKNIAITYRGTDGTIVGWKENLALSYLIETPSQYDALNFLNKTIKKYKHKTVTVVGHSKGGNLAEYASLKCLYPKLISKTINFDGPGNIDTSIYQNEDIQKKIVKYIPYESLIGILFNNRECKIVSCNDTKLQQHSMYNWNIDNYTKKFVLLSERSQFSKIIEKTFISWLQNIPVESREEIINQASDLLKLEINKKVDDLDISKTSLLFGMLKPKNAQLRDAAIDLLIKYNKNKKTQ